MEKTLLKNDATVDAEIQIIKIIDGMSGKYTPYVIFSDWVKMAAISIQNSCDIFHGNVWKEREKQYLDIADKYSHDELLNFCKMSGLLIEAFDNNGISDYLGNIYMKSGAGSKSTGQFFTPFHLSVLTASVALENVTEEKKIPMNEPSVGGGGMILAAAKVLQDKGINYQKCLDVLAQDLDWNSVYMTYFQLSLIGVKGVIAQGNSLADTYTVENYPNDRIYKTPKYLGVIM